MSPEHIETLVMVETLFKWPTEERKRGDTSTATAYYKIFSHLAVNPHV
jgi:hypothetical protein